MDTIDKPVFIIGTGRSGTTMMFYLLERHPEFAWPSQHMVGKYFDRYDVWNDHMSKIPFLLDYAKTKKRHRCLPEPYELWQKFYPGFVRPCRDLREEDVTRYAREGFRKIVSQQLNEMGKKRFLTKYTGWSRIGFIDNIFSDAHYVHLIRDGRAVAASLLTRDWWRGWYGPHQWRWGELNEENAGIWAKSNQSFFVLAGLQWKILMENVCEKGALIGNRYREVRYEDVMTNPQKEIAGIIEWAGLSADKYFLKFIDKSSFYNANEKWKEQINVSEIDQFDKLLGGALNRFGYGR